MKLPFLFLILFASNLFAQDEVLTIPWEKSGENVGNLALQLLEVSKGKWEYHHQWETNSSIDGRASKFQNVTYELVPNNWLSKIDINTLSSQVQEVFESSAARDQMYGVVKFSPFVKRNGQVMRVVSAKVQYAFAKATRKSVNVTPPISNSVLASGNFYKFYVEETGVHRISLDFLNSLGIQANEIDPERIKVYGIGGSPLPLRNSDTEYYDLREIPIQIIDGGDGSFDVEDTILFYGESTSKFHEELQTHVNPYSDKSYYYITVQGALGKRIGAYVQPLAAASTEITTYEDYQFHEEDNTSLVKIGRRWFGERFSFQSAQDFQFTFPNAAIGQMANLRVVAAAVSESGTSFNISVNGNSVGTISLGAITDITLARGSNLDVQIPITSQDFTVTVSYNNNGNPSSTGYLDYIALEVPTQLQGTGGQFVFTNNVTFQDNIGRYTLSEMQGYTQIWDVTDQTAITALPLQEEATVSFKALLDESRKFVAIAPSDYFLPFRESGNTLVQPQNLKGTIFQGSGGDFQDVDYLMITSRTLSAQAERLAQHNRTYRGLRVKTVTLEEIYEEFGGGRQDIGAIRNFIKYVYDNASDESNRVRYVCLFGDTSVDYKDRIAANNNVMPTFQTYESFNLVTSFMSDDFYGSMDPEEGTMRSADKLDIAVGRIVADTPQLAATVVDKIISYNEREAYGRWRNNFVLISDDVDKVFEFSQLQGTLDDLGERIRLEKPFINVIKIHSDAFQQQSSAGGNRYPKVNEAIANAIEVGSLVVTYLGHGSEDLLSSEAIVTNKEINALDNSNKLPLVVTVTCEFGKFDNPERPTGGEQLIWNPNGGAVSMVTTTREISVSLGVQFNNELAAQLFSFGSSAIQSVAENLRVSKNNIAGGLRRVIFYCGDPAMKLAFAKPDIQLTAVNDTPVSGELPQLRALDLVKMSGQVVDASGIPMSTYNGTLAVTLFDKRIERQTLGNDGTRNGAGELLIMDFTTLGPILYRGQASVENGLFDFTFRMPRDTSIPLGNGRLNFYAERTGVLEDQAGVNMSLVIGGLNEDAPEDNEGPSILLYMNDESFVDGGITNNSPIILAKLEDENGINTASGIGHDMIAILDGDETNPIVMNDFYETDVDDFTKGTAARKLRDLEPGVHTITFKAWDVYNNSSTATLQFVVVGNDDLALENVLNYPNPFVDYTEFWFNHNRPFEPLDVQVQIFTITGKVVKTINQTVVSDGNLSRDIQWNGLDDFGQPLGKGVYVYKITVKSTLTNKKVEKLEKLVIL